MPIGCLLLSCVSNKEQNTIRGSETPVSAQWLDGKCAKAVFMWPKPEGPDLYFKFIVMWHGGGGSTHSFSLLFFLFLNPRTGDPRHRKRLLRHDVVQRWLPAEAERRQHSCGPAAHQHGNQRHLSSDQGQGEEVGSDSVLTPGLTSDPPRLPVHHNRFAAEDVLLFSKFYAFLIYAPRGRAAKAFNWLTFFGLLNPSQVALDAFLFIPTQKKKKKSELSLLPIATRKWLMCASVVWYISLCLKTNKKKL